MAEEQAKISVLLVDDHAVVREGYRRLLERHGDIAVVGEAGNAAEAQLLFAKLSPQVVVMDIALPGASGIESMRRMLARRPQTRVLIFSMYEDLVYADRAMEAGACGYITKASAPGVLVEAVHAVARDKRYVSADIAQAIALRRYVGEMETANNLSSREFEVLRLLVQGFSVREIAKALQLHPKTVANHQSAIKQKLGADTPVRLVRLGSELLSDEGTEL